MSGGLGAWTTYTGTCVAHACLDVVRGLGCPRPACEGAPLSLHQDVCVFFCLCVAFVCACTYIYALCNRDAATASDVEREAYKAEILYVFTGTNLTYRYIHA